MELWFHALAMVDVRGPGALPFYDPQYAERVTAMKKERHIRPSLLDRMSARLRARFAADSAFEVLHFLPLYVREDEPAALVSVIRQTASARPPRAGEPRALAIRALQSALPTASERALLSDLADAIDDEWATFLAQRWSADASRRNVRVSQLQRDWNGRFMPVLGAYLRGLGLEHGSIVVLDAIGLEGRVARAVSNSTSETLVVVGTLADRDAADGPLLAATRELCFPLIEQSMLALPVANEPDPATGSAESSRAAVRCGALLLDASSPALARSFRNLYLAPRAGESTAEYHRRFDARYHIAPELARALSASIARLTSTTGTLP